MRMPSKYDIIEADSLSTSSALLPVSVIKSMGYLDSKHFAHNYSDLDYFDRLKYSGYKLLINMRSRIHTKGSDSNYQGLLMRLSLREIAATFFNMKYANNLVTLYYRSTLRNRFLVGYFTFLFTLLVHAGWFLVRIAIGKAWGQKAI